MSEKSRVFAAFACFLALLAVVSSWSSRRAESAASRSFSSPSVTLPSLAETLAAKHAELAMLSHAKQIIHSSDTALNLLALHFMNHGEDMPEAEMENVLTAWRNNPNTVLAAIDQTSKLISLREGLMQTPTSVPTLANFHGDHELSAMLQQQKLSGGDAALCGKKEIILHKFDSLLLKLTAQESSLKQQLTEVTEKWKEASEAWLDTVTVYRLRSQQFHEAEAGSKMALEELARLKTAQNAAKNEEAQHEKNDGKQLKALKKEDRYISSIRKLDTVIQKYNGNPTTVRRATKKIAGKVKKLEKVAAKTAVPGAQDNINILKTDVKSGKIKGFEEAKTVGKVLEHMLDDDASQVEQMGRELKAAQQLVIDSKAEMRNTRLQVVTLSMIKDKAHGQAAALQNEKEELSGVKKESANLKEEAEEAAQVEIPPFDREIFVISTIKKKIQDFCPSDERGESGGDKTASNIVAAPTVTPTPPPPPPPASDTGGGGRRHRQDRH